MKTKDFLTNSDITIELVQTDAQIKATAQLAREIWQQHFTPIIGQAQVEYMLATMQSPEAIKKAVMQEGYRYFLILFAGDAVGYTAICPQEGRLFLSKLYVREEYRGKKIAKTVLALLEKIAQQENLSAIYLTCNRENEDTLMAYDALGFAVIAKQDADIGNGFVMNDYILEKKMGE